MQEEVYHRLARRLDAIPNGFPATGSGVELQLLAKLFTPEEAKLANVMRLIPESAADIALRAATDPAIALGTLQEMAGKETIRIRLREGQPLFGLKPFLQDLWSDQLPRLDEELARLAEQYYQETEGTVVGYEPALRRVIPVEEAIPSNLEIFPYERAVELLGGARSWAVRDCVCRVQQRLLGKGCDHPAENCLIFAPIEGLFNDSKDLRTITQEEALRILQESEKLGLVHTLNNYRDEHYNICNCCTCCCGMLRGVVEFDIPAAIAHSDFHIAIDAELCAGSGNCVESCRFGALSVRGNLAVLDHARCVGCGLCIASCLNDALLLERRPEGEIHLLPADEAEWMTHRAEARGIPLSGIL